MNSYLLTYASYVATVMFGRATGQLRDAIRIGEAKLAERVTANNEVGEFYRANEDLYYDHHSRLRADLFSAMGALQGAPLATALRRAIAAGIVDSLKANFEQRMCNAKLLAWRRHCGMRAPGKRS